MSKQSEPVVEQPAEQPKTIAQHEADLRAWLAERGLGLAVIARGVRSGQPASILDFMGENHVAESVLVPARQNGANRTGSG